MSAVHKSRRQVICGLAVLLAAAAAATADAQTLSGEYKAPPVNATFHFAEGGRTRITSVNGFEFYRTAGQREVYQYGYLIFDSTQKFDRKEIDAFWPLAVGKTLRTQVDGIDGKGNQWTATLDAKVVGIEEIKVPAGTYQAFKIERTLRNQYYQESSTFYWAPEAAYSIKGEFSNSTGRSSTWTLERIAPP